MDHTDTDDLMRLLDASPSPFHAATEIARRLAEAGSTAVDPDGRWTSDDVNGFRHLIRDGAVIAWRLEPSTAPPSQARIVGAHTDSPCLRLKPRPDTAAHGWRQLDVEVYGGVLLNSWLDRDLGIAGRVIGPDGRSHLVRSGAVARVPQLAIHLDRGVNEGLKLDPQTHLIPVWGLGDRRDDIAEWLGALAGIERATWWDLCLFDTQPASVIGRDSELLASARLDNLVSCWAATAALIGSGPAPAGRLHIMVLNDHEEVGSASVTGAEGPLLEHVLLRIVSALGGDSADLACMLGAVQLRVGRQCPCRPPELRRPSRLPACAPHQRRAGREGQRQPALCHLSRNGRHVRGSLPRHRHPVAGVLVAQQHAVWLDDRSDHRHPARRRHGRRRRSPVVDALGA